VGPDGSNDRAFTGLGFQPDVVIIKGDSGAEASIRTSTMTGDVSTSLGSGATLLDNRMPGSVCRYPRWYRPAWAV